MTNNRTIDNVKIIAGIFRECIISRADVKVDGRYRAKITHVEEGSRRSRNEQKNVFIVVDTDPEIPEICSLDIFFSNFKISTNIRIIKIENCEIQIPMPETLLVTNLREDKRIEPRYSKLPSTTVLLINEDIHQEVPFKLVNVSKYGLAGDIEIDRNHNVFPGARILGKIVSHDGTIDVSGQVVAAQITLQTGDLKSVTVRLLKNETAGDSNQLSDIGNKHERRNEPRFVTRFDVTMQCILMPLQTIDFEIEDVSVTGFSAICKTPMMQTLLLPGIPLRMKDSSLVAQVLYHNDGSIRC